LLGNSAPYILLNPTSQTPGKPLPTNIQLNSYHNDTQNHANYNAESRK